MSFKILRLTAICFAASSVALFAQEDALPPDPPPVVDPQPDVAGETPPLPDQEGPIDLPIVIPGGDPEVQERISINLPKATGNDIAQLYRQLTDKRVLVDANAIAVEANIVVFGDLTNKEEAARAFEKAMLLNGFAVVPSGPDEVKIINVNSVNQNSSARGQGLPVISDPIDIPEGDNVITYVMALRYILPEEAKKTFEAVVTKLNNYGTIAAVPNASALIITENANLIRKFIQIKDMIDKPSQNIETRWISVQYADVESLAATLEKILQPKQDAAQQTARRTVTIQGQTFYRAGGPPQGGNPGEATQGGSSDTPPQVIPDLRTNRLLLMGRPIDLVFLENLIREFDVSTDTRNFLRRPLKYLSVLDFMPVAQNALQRLNPVDPNAQGQANQQQQQLNNLVNRNNQGSNTSSTGSTTDLLSDPNDSGAPDSVIVGRTLLVADTITNSIVVQGPPQSIEVVTELLNQIDKRGPQVMITTIFGQFRRTNEREFGLDWVATLRKDGRFTWGGTDFNSTSAWNPSLPDNDPSVFNSSLNGLSFYGKFANNINFLLRAALETGHFSVTSRQTVYTVNNKKAVINSGQKVPVPTSSATAINSTGEGLTQNTSFNYMEVALQLEVIPLVNSPNEVTLQVGQQNNQITGYQRVNGTDGYDVPIVSIQKIVTTVTVPNGGTIILGGLVTREKNEQRSGIPILSDIPLLGWAFSYNQKTQEERENVVFLQPTIVSSNDEGLYSQTKERSFYQVTPDILEAQGMEVATPMADEGLLPLDYQNTEPLYDQTVTQIPDPSHPVQQAAPARQPSQPTQQQKTQKSINSAIRPFGPF